jgi:hypothetical protein
MAAKVHRTLTPRIVARIIQAHNGQHTLGGMPGVPAAWLRAAALRSLGKYSLSETDVLRSANDANGATPDRSGRSRQAVGASKADRGRAPYSGDSLAKVIPNHERVHPSG